MVENKIERLKIKLKGTKAKIIEGKEHLYINMKGDTVKQGWKIHVSCFFDNYLPILEIVSNYCINNSINFKFVRTNETLAYLLSKNAPRESSGKFITIYPNNDRSFEKILKDLYVKLKMYEGPYILTNKRYKNCKVLYYRYGVFVCDSENNGYLLDKFGNKYQDRPGPYYYLPPFIKEPFSDNGIHMENSKIGPIYNVLDAYVIVNGGGVYRAQNKTTLEQVVLKEARPYVGVSKNATAISFRKHEAEMLIKLSDCPYIPNLIEKFYEWEHFYIVEELIEGQTLYDFQMKYGLTLFQKDNKEVNNIAKKIQDIVMQLLLLFSYFNQRGIVINDVSLNNFMLSDEDKLYLIDLEDAYDQKVTVNYEVKTPYFSNDKIDSCSDLDKDKQKLGYLIMNILSSANEHLRSDITGNLSNQVFKQFCETYSINKVYEELVLGLINCPKDLNFNEEILKIKNIELIDRNKEVQLIYNFRVPKIIKQTKESVTMRVSSKNVPIMNEEVYSIKKNYEMGKFINLSAENGLLKVAKNILDIAQKIDSSYYTTFRELLEIAYSYRIDTYEGPLLKCGPNAASPYLNFTGGYIRLSLEYLSLQEDKLLAERIRKMLKAIDNDFPKDFSYKNGLAGLADIYLDAFEYYQCSFYLESSFRKADILKKVYGENYDMLYAEGRNIFFNRLKIYTLEERVHV